MPFHVLVFRFPVFRLPGFRFCGTRRREQLETLKGFTSSLQFLTFPGLAETNENAMGCSWVPEGSASFHSFVRGIFCIRERNPILNTLYSHVYNFTLRTFDSDNTPQQRLPHPNPKPNDIPTPSLLGGHDPATLTAPVSLSISGNQRPHNNYALRLTVTCSSHFHPLMQWCAFFEEFTLYREGPSILGALTMS